MTVGYRDDPRPDIQALVAPRGQRCLDVGCGEGALSESLRAAGAVHVAGIEFDEAAAARAGGHLDVVVAGDVMEVALPFRPGEFDYIICADVLEHLPDPDAALRRLLPYLADGGRLVVSVPNMRFYAVLARLIFDRWAYTDSGVRDRTHLRIVTRHSLERMLDSHDLEIERLERNYRLFEDQSRIGRIGALATRVVRATIAPWLFPDLLAFQFVAVARRRVR
jgi:2-polyprenyl-3-methyl-5-hydroxy-6-metoxy-1,4-benzoquinol methylase